LRSASDARAVAAAASDRSGRPDTAHADTGGTRQGHHARNACSRVLEARLRNPGSTVTSIWIAELEQRQDDDANARRGSPICFRGPETGGEQPEEGRIDYGVVCFFSRVVRDRRPRQLCCSHVPRLWGVAQPRTNMVPGESARARRGSFLQVVGRRKPHSWASNHES